MSSGASKRAAPVALMTDFGYRDHYAGVMKGVIATISPGSAIIDLTHGVPAQSIAAGAIALRESWRFFPADTVFVAIVDPGVGTTRLPIAIETRAGARLVGPDNGVLSLAAEEAGVKRVVRIESERYRMPAVSATFHGRDIFAPAAAHLARGLSISRLGRRLSAFERLELPRPSAGRKRIDGEVIYVDGFGNLVTNIARGDINRLKASFPARNVSVRIDKGAPISIFDTYGDAPSGAILATFGSFELLEIAVRNGNAAERLGCTAGARVAVRIAR